MKVENCFLCRLEATAVQRFGDGLAVNCPRCGTYEASGTLVALLGHPQCAEFLPYASAYARQASERGEIARFNSHNWRAAAEAHRHTPIDQKLDRLLRFFAGLSSRPGHEFLPTDASRHYPLFDAANPDEVEYLIDVLVGQKLIERRPPEYARLTPNGWRQLAPLTPGGVPGTCFVAMAFDPSLEEAYERGIEPAVRRCGLGVVRVDKVEHNGIVTDLILSEIRRAQVTIADVTLQRNGVYFEAGFALGLGRVVIWTCRANDLENVHFDTRQYSHVIWDDAADLAARLERRIRSTVSVAIR